MRGSMLRTIVAREWLEIMRNRLLLFSILIPPIILSILPVVLLRFVGDARNLPEAAIAQIVANHPVWADMAPQLVAKAFALQQFLVTFLLLPAYIPLSIASYSIVGEKQSRSLEAVLATPVQTTELLTGKSIAAVVPAIAAAWFAYFLFLDLAAVLLDPRLVQVISEPAWIGAVFAFGPAIGLVSVTAGVLVSSRVNDPRSAQQIGAVILLPIIAPRRHPDRGQLPRGPADVPHRVGGGRGARGDRHPGRRAGVRARDDPDQVEVGRA